VNRLLAIFGALLGILLVPLALIGPTAVLLLPAHLAFTATATAGALGEGVAGHPERARWWGLMHLVGSFAMVGALELGARIIEHSAYWVVPWTAAVLWGWIPSVTAGVAGWAGEGILRWRSGRAVRLRHRRRARAPAAQQRRGDGEG
jgi:hypothetical protein